MSKRLPTCRMVRSCHCTTSISGCETSYYSINGCPGSTYGHISSRSFTITIPHFASAVYRWRKINEYSLPDIHIYIYMYIIIYIYTLCQCLQKTSLSLLGGGVWWGCSFNGHVKGTIIHLDFVKFASWTGIVLAILRGYWVWYYPVYA